MAEFQFNDNSKHSKSEKDEHYEIHNKANAYFVDQLWVLLAGSLR